MSNTENFIETAISDKANELGRKISHTENFIAIAVNDLTELQLFCAVNEIDIYKFQSSIDKIKSNIRELRYLVYREATERMSEVVK